MNAIHDEIKNSKSAPIVRDIVYIFKIVRVFMKKTWPNPILHARFDAFERENSILLRNIIFDFIFFLRNLCGTSLSLWVFAITSKHQTK